MSNKKLVYLDDVRRAILQVSPSSAFCLNGVKPVDAVEVVRVEEVKQEILQQMDMFIAEYNRIGFYGKSDVMDIARRLVNAALTDLAKIDGENEDGA